MERVRKIVHKNKEIIILDYSGVKPGKMVDIFDQGKQLIIAEGKAGLSGEHLL